MALRPILTLAVLAAIVLAHPVGALEPAEIADQVARLSDPDYQVRERATAALWSAGSAAEPELRHALHGDDPEVVRRANSLLTRLRLGLHPDTPQPILDLVQQYRTSENAARIAAIEGLANQGPRGLRVLLGLRNGERDEQLRGLLLRAIGARPHEREGAALLLAEGDPAAGDLLKAAAEDGESAARDWAALLLLRGGLDEQIAATRAVVKTSADGRAATRLAYLARARGDLALAAIAADQADDPHLVDSILIESGDWKRLAQRYHDRVGSTSDTLGFTAAFCRLTGDAEGLEAAVAALQSFADRHDEEFENCAECLMLNDRVDEGIAVLLSRKQYIAAIDFLLPRLEYKQVLSLPEKAQADLKLAELLQLRARVISVCRFTGDRQAGLTALHAVASDNGATKDIQTFLLLSDAAAELNEPEQADRFLVAAMEQGAAALGRAGLPDDFPSVYWSTFFRAQHLGESYAKRLKRLRDLGSGRLSAAEVDALVSAAELAADRQPPADQERSLQAIARTLQMLNRPAEAERVYRKLAELYPTVASLQLLGDCQAARGNFSRAAAVYESAWDLDRTRAMPLALRGWALLHGGDAAQARQVLDLCHVLPLGDQAQRTALEEMFRRHELPEDARRERDCILKTGQLLSWDVGNANRLAGYEAHSRGEYLAAANFWEHAFLGNLQRNTSFTEPWANVVIPAMIHRARALGLMKEDAPGALREARAAMKDNPGDANTLIDLVLAFEQAGHKAEADLLYAPTAAMYEQLCRDYPDSGPRYNELAWVQGRCRRNLDQALNHARRAVELEPRNTANIDTLATVYFERGEIGQAVAQMEKCVELEPGVAGHREQLEKFRAALAANNKSGGG